MEKKFVLFAFNGELMCFAHVLLNALDMLNEGYDVKIVIEGTATKVIKQFHEDSKTPFSPLYKKVKELNLIAAVCKACSAKMGVTDSVEAEKLPLIGNMDGHPSMSQYIEKGYKIITF